MLSNNCPQFTPTTLYNLNIITRSPQTMFTTRPIVSLIEEVKDMEMSLAVLFCFSFPIMVSICYFLCGKYLGHDKRREYDSRGSWRAVFLVVSFVLNFARLHDWITEQLARSKTNTAKVWLPGHSIVLTSDPANLEYMLRTKFNDFIKGDMFYEALRDFVGESILILNGHHFTLLSRAYLAGLSSPSFRALGHYTVSHQLHQSLLPELDRASRSGSHVDMREVIADFTFHVMAKAGLGIDPQDIPGSESFLYSFDNAADLSPVRLAFPKVVWKCMRTLKVGGEGRLLASVKEVDAWIDEALRFRNNIKLDLNGLRQGVPTDCLSAVLTQVPSLREGRCPRDLAIGIILAGKDTVTTALLWFFWALCKYPRVEENVYNEVSSIVKKRLPKDKGDDEDFSEEEMKDMQYLHATLSEVLRLYPPVPLNVVEAKNDEVMPDGSLVEKGSSVMYSVYAYGRNEEVWGNDASEFRPERWLSVDGGRFVGRSEYKFMAFNAGPRRCLGREFAYLMMKRVAASVVLGFKMSLLPNAKIVPKVSISLGMKYGLPLLIKRRYAVPAEQGHQHGKM